MLKWNDENLNMLNLEKIACFKLSKQIFQPESQVALYLNSVDANRKQLHQARIYFIQNIQYQEDSNFSTIILKKSLGSFNLSKFRVK